MEAEEFVIKRIAALLLLAATVAGCGHPMIPASALSQFDQPGATEQAGPESEFAAIGANGPVLGVNLYALKNYSAVRVEADGKRMLSYIRNVLHASAVDIVWNFYAPSFYANAVDSTSATLSASNVAILTAIAKQDDLLVEYRPLIMIYGDHPWEGHIEPTDPQLWFSNYYNMELPYLQVAQQYGINEFVAATEMSGLNNSPYWSAFFARIGGIYHGVVSYAASENEYFPPNMKLFHVSDVGVDMYEPIPLSASASEAQVTTAYESFFAGVPSSVLRRTAIDETGIEARAGAYQGPSFMTIPGVLNEAVQANWFLAACHTVQRYHLRAVFFWKVDLTDYPLTHPASSLSTFEGKEGAKAIAMCANILSGD
jgi:hypothetical protein